MDDYLKVRIKMKEILDEIHQKFGIEVVYGPQTCNGEELMKIINERKRLSSKADNKK